MYTYCNHEVTRERTNHPLQGGFGLVQDVKSPPITFSYIFVNKSFGY